MDIKILESCIGCGQCVKACPAMVFTLSDKRAYAANSENCIACSHCVAVCPTNSVQHSEFSPEIVHPIDYSQLPSDEQLLLLLNARRSNRNLSSKPVPRELIDKILSAANTAPTASNLRQVSYTVITRREELDFTIEYTLDYFRRMLKLIKMPIVGSLIRRFVPGAKRYAKSFERLVKEWEENRTDRILRSATALILIHTPRNNRFGATDSQLAYQNGSLMATALGVSQIYTGFLCSAILADRKRRLAKKLGIDGEIHAGMALGIPVAQFPRYVDKCPLKVEFRE